MQAPEQQPMEQQQQPEEQHGSGRWQNLICNALTLVGLVAVVIVGGSSILADVEKEIAEPTPATEDVAPTTQDTFEPLAPEPLPMPEPVVEEEPVDSLALDTALNLPPTVESPADTVATHPTSHSATVPVETTTPVTTSADSAAHHTHGS